MEDYIDVAIKSLTQQLVKESVNLFGKVTNETKRLFDKSLRLYFIRQKEKYANVKTILFGNTPMKLYDVFYPLNLRRKLDVLQTDKVENLFLETNFVSIIGSAGSGKSMLLKHLLLNSIIEKFGIPVLIELRYLNEYTGTIEDYIVEVIFDNQIPQDIKLLKKLLKNGRFIFFLDGFDEINSDTKENTIKQLDLFVNKNNKNKYILTSRPYTDIEFFPLFHNYFIQDLDGKKIEGFIKLQLKDQQEFAANIISSIQNTEKSYIKSFLSNPLLLSLYILTFQNNPDIPKKKYIYYRRVVQALFSEHDSKSKLGYSRERRSGLSQEDFEDVLKRFSILAFSNKKYVFDLDYILATLDIIKSKSINKGFDSHLLIGDLKVGLALWIEDGLYIQFAHKSLQEYFAALYVAELNIKQKAKVYLKMIDELGSKGEVRNFLAMCKEMDEIAYSKLFLIPVITKINSSLNLKRIDKLIAKYVAERFSAIGISEYSLTPYNWPGTSDPLKNITEIRPLFKDLDFFLWKQIDHIAKGQSGVKIKGWMLDGPEYISEEYGEENVYYLSMTPVQENIITYLKEQGIISYFEDIKRNLLKLQLSTNEFIKSSEKADDDIIDLI